MFVILGPPSRFSSSRTNLLIMPRQNTIKLSSSYRRRNLVNLFNPTQDTMRVCKNCERTGTPDKCKVGGSSDRCIECARKTYSYNLAPFSPARWAKIRKERSKTLLE